MPQNDKTFTKKQLHADFNPQFRHIQAVRNALITLLIHLQKKNYHHNFVLPYV